MSNVQVQIGGNTVSVQVQSSGYARASEAVREAAESAAAAAAELATAALKANNLSDLASASTARTNLGLGTVALQDADDVAITGGSATGLSDLAISTNSTVGAAPLRVGTYGGTASDTGIAISRDMFDAGVDNGHGFVEASLFRRSGGLAFAAFDATTAMVGNSYDHWAAFQDRGAFQAGNGAQTITNLYGLYSQSNIDTGTAVNRFGAYVAAPTLTNGGAITNQYAYYAENLTGATNDWAFYAAGTTASYFGGAVTLNAGIAGGFTAASGLFAVSASGIPTIGTYGATSTDPGVVISRNMFDVSTTAGHGFVEATYFRRPGTNAFAAFDAITVMAGNAYDHYVSFQDRGAFQAATVGQVMTDLFGFHSRPSIADGAVTNRYGLYVAEPVVTGGGTIGTQYGMYVAPFTAGTTKWGVYVDSTTPSYFGGAVTLNGGITGQVVTGRGTAGAPAYTFTSDLDVGMWSPSANVLAFSTSGVEAVRVHSSRNVSIGNTTDTDKLSVTGDIRASNRFYGVGTSAYVKLDDSNGAQLVYSTTNLTIGGPMVLYSSGVEKWRVNAGTGDTTGAGFLQALSGTAIPAGGTAGAGVKMFSTSNFGIFGGSGAPTLSAAKGSLYLRSDGSGINDRMYVNTNGSTTWTAVVTVA